VAEGGEAGDPTGGPALPRGWSGPPPAAAAPVPGAWAGAPPPVVAATCSAVPDGPVRSPAGAASAGPLRFTELLDGAFALCRGSARTLAVLVLAVHVPLQLGAAFLQRDALRLGLGALLDDPAAADAALGGPLDGGVLATLAVQVVVGALLAGALTAVVLGARAGRPVRPAEAARAAARRAGWLVGAAVAGWLVRGALLLLVPVGAAVGSDPLVAIGIATGVPLALALTPLVAVVTPALVAAPRPGRAVVVHAVLLGARGWWRVLGVVVGTTGVIALVAGLLAGIPNVTGAVAGGGYGWVLVAVGNVVAQGVAAPLTAAAMVLLLEDLRARQEGADLDALVAEVRARRPGGRPGVAGAVGGA
jgi:hypothetical protein